MVEGANFAIRYNPKVKRFYQRKKDKTNGMGALKAVAHKLARACYYILALSGGEGLRMSE